MAAVAAIVGASARLSMTQRAAVIEDLYADEDFDTMDRDRSYVVTTPDGVPLAVSDGIPPDRLERLSAITSGLISLAQGTASMLDCGAVTQTLVTMQEGVLVIVAISDGSSLAVLAAIDADLDQIAYEMTVLAEQAGSVLTPDARPPRAAGAWA